MKTKVSIIVPVYNVEKYLRKCEDSILSQTYGNIELILVDDGSPDACPLICDDYARENVCVKVIHKNNGGLSDARNVGLEQATGDYVMFVDSDDFWVGEDSLERLIRETELSPQCDFIGFNFFNYYESEDLYAQWKPYDEHIVGGKDKDSLIQALVRSGVVPMSAWGKIIKRDFLEKNNIRFIKGLLSEDIPWFLELLHHACGFRMVNQYMYAYRQQRLDSITRTFSKRHFSDLQQIIQEGVVYIQRANFSYSTTNALYSFMAYELCILYGSLYKIKDSLWQNKKRGELRQWKWLLRYKCNPKVRKAYWIYRLVGLYGMEWTLSLFMKSKR